MNRCFSFGLILAYLVSCQALADSYWVVGSYRQNAMADSEADRLSALTGTSIKVVEYSVTGRRFFRVLISAADFDDEVLSQLTEIGIKPWLVSFTRGNQPEAGDTVTASPGIGIAPIEDIPPVISDTTDLSTTTDVSDSLYVIAASSTEVEEALELERTLSEKFLSVRGETALVDGQVVHRILIGPLLQRQVASTRFRLENMGFEDTPTVWIKNEYAIDYQDEFPFETYIDIDVERDADPDLVRTQFISRSSLREIKKQLLPKNPTGYNLARLPEKKSDSKP